MTTFRAALLLAGCLFALSALPARAQLLHDVTHASVAVDERSRQIEGASLVTTFSSGTIPQHYDGVVLQGVSDSPTLKGWIRVASRDAWEPLYLVRSATGPTFLASFRSGRAPVHETFTVRFVSQSPYHVVLSGAGTFDSRLDTAEPAQSARGGTGLRKTHSGLVPPLLTTRAEWNAAPFRGTPSPLAPQGYVRLTFHHAAGFGAETRAEAIAQVRAIQDFHQNGRGWSDIGYQFVMDQRGRIYQGRPFLDGTTTLREVPRLALGAHVGGANTGNIGVSVLGCYHPAEPSIPCTDRLSAAAVDSLVTLLAFLSDAYGVDADQLMGHRDQSATSCPGDNNYALLEDLKRAIVELQAGQPPEASTPDRIALAAAAPNPVRDRTLLRYYLHGEGFVSLTVYNATGQVVGQPVARAYQDDVRWYEVPFDASGLASGTYFIRLRVEGFQGTAFDGTQTLTVVR